MISLDEDTGKIELPVYLNSTREDLLFTVDLPVQPVSLLYCVFYAVVTDRLSYFPPVSELHPSAIVYKLNGPEIFLKKLRCPCTK
jgi:hypothetical protein